MRYKTKILSLVCVLMLPLGLLGCSQELPENDMDMFCFLIGVGIAKTTCKIAYADLENHQFASFHKFSPCKRIIIAEEKKRLILYDKLYDLVKSYICEVKKLNTMKND